MNISGFDLLRRLNPLLVIAIMARPQYVDNEKAEADDKLSVMRESCVGRSSSIQLQYCTAVHMLQR